MRFHDRLVAVEHELEFLLHVRRAAARGNEMLATRELRGLAESERHAVVASQILQQVEYLGLHRHIERA